MHPAGTSSTKPPTPSQSFVVMPFNAQCRILWCQVSKLFHPEDLPIGDENNENRLTGDVLEGHGYDVVGGGWFNKPLQFKERSSGELERSLLFVRVWSQTSIRAATRSTMLPDVLKGSCFWDAPVPSKQHIIPKITDGLAIKLPASGGGLAW